MKLEGIKVIDLSMFLPGPHLTMMMADHDAEVIRIEPPAGEPTRALGASQNGMTVWFRNSMILLGSSFIMLVVLRFVLRRQLKRSGM